MLKEMKSLYLLQTEILILPDYIEDLINLDWLDPSQTKVSTLSHSTGALKVLRVLKLLQKMYQCFLSQLVLFK